MKLMTSSKGLMRWSMLNWRSAICSYNLVFALSALWFASLIGTFLSSISSSMSELQTIILRFFTCVALLNFADFFIVILTISPLRHFIICLFLDALFVDALASHPNSLPIGFLAYVVFVASVVVFIDSWNKHAYYPLALLISLTKSAVFSVISASASKVFLFNWSWVLYLP